MADVIPIRFSSKFLEKFGDTVAEWWNDRWKKTTVYYPTDGVTMTDPRELLKAKFEPTPKLQSFLDSIKSLDNDDKAYMIHRWILKTLPFKYKSDSEIWHKTEYWQTPQITLELGTGDCISADQMVITKVGLKKAEDIQIGDLMLSYDFAGKDYVYKPIINLWNKGIKHIKRVHFRNGSHIDVTDEHHMLVRENQQGISKYERCDLKDVDLTRWWKKKVPCAVKIPYDPKDIDWLDERLCFILGHFLAEGSIENDWHIETSGHEVYDYILPILEEHDIPYTERINNSGVPVIRFGKSKFKEFISKFRTDSDSMSFTGHLPMELLDLPISKLQAILDGYFLGDGHNHIRCNKVGKMEKIYSTSSHSLANQFQHIALKLGYPLYVYKQEHHGGIGTKPIYRLHDYENSRFRQMYGYPNMSEVSISYIEDLGESQTYDWEVEDTHNFFFANGICTAQCEDASLLWLKIVEIAGIPNYRCKIYCGDTDGGGHAYPCYLSEEGNRWVSMDLTYYAKILQIEYRAAVQDIRYYGRVWFSFNRSTIWAQHDTLIKYS
uniref:DOD-type homing endonuclease domain-containing protein n=1 Tax=viral metagenome TaxID=1070528 RepID=A0A6M3MA72_9ZZZZ